MPLALQGLTQVEKMLISPMMPIYEDLSYGLHVARGYHVKLLCQN